MTNGLGVGELAVLETGLRRESGVARHVRRRYLLRFNAACGDQSRLTTPRGLSPTPLVPIAVHLVPLRSTIMRIRGAAALASSVKHQ